jgi:hypothetical protein
MIDIKDRLRQKGKLGQVYKWFFEDEIKEANQRSIPPKGSSFDTLLKSKRTSVNKSSDLSKILHENNRKHT